MPEEADPILDAAMAALADVKFARDESEVALVLGSGFGAIEDQCKTRAQVAYNDVPGFSRPTGVAGHLCRLTQGTLWGRKTLVLRGRYHAYEGFAVRELVFPVRVARALGCKTLVLTNAAGGIREDLTPGTLMAITDHLNLMGVNPLMGRSRMAGAPRFPAMAGAYAEDLTEQLMRAATAADVAMLRGVYAAVLGPSFETAAEVRMLRNVGADAVGMSTVPEAICGHALGMRVCGFSLITNRAGEKTDDHERGLKLAEERSSRIARVLEGLFKHGGS
ncbi:MAG: purine-nucleoside phosphorylase [Planctomycetes bacterium]|nr:purine-nucleoside phosphorylase [Planctomycetota bacterium]